MTTIGRPPVNAPYKVQRQPGEESKKLVFDASWEVHESPPNTLVGLKAASRVPIQAGSAEIKIFQVLGNQRTPVDLLTVALENGKARTQWRTKAVKAGNFEAGVYHFEISVGGYTGETVTPLILRDKIAQTYKSSFESGSKAKPKVVF